MSAKDPRRWAEGNREQAAWYVRHYVGHLTKARDICTPGAPVAALIGIACNGGVNENTTGWITGTAAEREDALRKGRYPLKNRSPREGYGSIGGRRSLHELGPFGVEAEYTPNEVAKGSCPWVSLAMTSEMVKEALGRRGKIGADWFDAVEDQFVIGVANINRHGRAVNARLDKRLRWIEDGDRGPKVWTLWSLGMAAMAWSAGAGGASKHVNAYADRLAAMDPTRWFGEFMRFAAEDDDDARKHRADEYSAIRTWQKMQCGLLAAKYTSEDAAWFDDFLADRDAVMTELTRVSKDNE